MIIDILARTSKVEKDKLLSLAATSDVRYKTYQIPKRSGGLRTIHHPSRELKAVQRWLAKIVFERFSVHQAATAYRIGAGIRENAEAHRKTSYTNRYDFASFFPSFKRKHIQMFLEHNCKNIGLDLTDEDIDFICDIVCRGDALTIGAPSSPSITNAMMFEFDKTFTALCAEQKLIYTRYADDIFVSSNEPDKLNDLENQIQKIKRDITYLSLRLNRRKTTFLSKKYRRTITGIVITSDQKLSIGRERKREIKALVHKWLTGRLKLGEPEYMRGLLAFASDVEPAFKQSLIRKYGEQAIRSIMQSSDLSISASNYEIRYWHIIKELT